MSAAFLSPRRSWVSWLAAGAAVFWHGAAWCQPGALERHTAIYDSARQRMVVFGGIAGTQPTNGAWELALSSAPEWAALAPAGTSPSRRFGHSAIYDPLRDRMIVFGGQVDASVLDDVWALSLSDPPAWTSLQPAGSAPPARLHHTAIYDPVRDRIVFFGGSDSFGIPFGDVWCLWLAPAPRWEQIVPSGTAPAERLGHSAIYDPVRDRMLVFSGGGFATDDVWGLSLGGQPAWTQLQPSGTRPAHRIGHSAIYDPRRDRMIVFGGYDFNQYLNDVWELPLTGTAAWSRVLGMGDPPSPRGFHSAVYDSAYDRAVVFGGIPNVSEPTWAFSLAPPMRWSPSRPAIQVSATELQLPTVTLGDTVSVPFLISNVGLEPLQVTDFRLPTTAMRLSSAAPLGLAWNETVPETLFLAASETLPAQDSVVIVSNDPLVPRKQVSLRVEVLGLDFETRILGDPPEVPLGASVVVVVTPMPGVRVERSTLYYRIANSGSGFDSLSFTPLATDFIAAIPASAVTEHGVEYYVKVENSGFVATEPPTAPATVFTQTVAAPVSFAAVPRPTSGSDFLAGRDIEVEVVLPAGSSFVSGTIHYRQGGEQSYETDTLSLVLGRPVGIIPARLVGARGVEYRVEVTTFRTTLRYPETESMPAIIRTKVQDLAEPLAHPGGRYRLLTVPLDFGTDFSGSLEALLTDQLGTYDPVRWRSYSYDPISEINIELSPAEAARFRPQPGRAFWLISREAHRVDTKPIDGLSTPTGREYPIPLAAGWNLFGNPFDFPVAWSDVRRNADAVGGPVAFDPSLGGIGDYAGDTPSVLAPFEGYFIHATQPESLWVLPRATASLTLANDAPSAGANMASTISRAANEDPAGSWRLQMRAWTDQSMDGSNVLGLHSGAAEGFDALDWLKPPPPPGAWVQAAFAHPEWQQRSGRYRRDLRGPGSEGQTWEIEVRNSSSADPVTLELSEIVPPPAGLALRLIDREQGSSVDWLRGGLPDEAQDGFRHRILSFGPRPYRLAIVAGTQEYVARVTSQALTVPVRLTLDQNAPNPFRTATRIRLGLSRAEPVTLEIFSLLGQRVAAPLDRVALGPGYHSVVWDGTISEGGRAPSGVYLLRVAAGGASLTRRIVLVR